MTPITAFNYIWASPASVLGVCAAGIASLAGAEIKRVCGVLEVSLAPRSAMLCTAVACLPFAAITLGHVVIACSAEEQAAHRAHERVHVVQYEVWGPVFLLAYPLESLYQALRGFVDTSFIWTTGLRQPREQPAAIRVEQAIKVVREEGYCYYINSCLRIHYSG